MTTNCFKYASKTRMIYWKLLTFTSTAGHQYHTTRPPLFDKLLFYDDSF